MAKSNKDSPVPRPHKSAEYEIYFSTSQAAKSWRDLLATRRVDLVDAWEFLTATPLNRTALSYPLKGEVAKIIKDGLEHQRWQLKLSPTHGARIWYFVVDRKVMIEAVHTAHPNQTK